MNNLTSLTIFSKSLDPRATTFTERRRGKSTDYVPKIIFLQLS